MPHPAQPQPSSPLSHPLRVALFTDTLADINGVSRFIRNMAQQAHSNNHELHLLTSTEKTCPDSIHRLHNFEPLHAAPMPLYPQLDLAFPPALAMLRKARQLRPDVIHVSTPGPIGAVGMLAAKLLGKPLLGVYHTDFPAYLERMCHSHTMGRLGSHTMGLMYKRFTRIFVRTKSCISSVEQLGINSKKITIFPPGIDTALFHPRFRNPNLFGQLHQHEKLSVSPRSIKFLYVGRVSIEKNTPMLAALWPAIRQRCAAQSIHAELLVVGDGPSRTSLQNSLKSTGTHFLGFRHGQQLSELYASCDIFLFPSDTDTLGQVVMEAQASALPALVTDQGGPQTIVQHGSTGYVIPSHDHALWIDRAVQLVTNPALRQQFGAAAHAHMRHHGLAHSYNSFWTEHQRAQHEHSHV
jgi:glycosyltransferase involved in cell wall biosynthesis